MKALIWDGTQAKVVHDRKPPAIRGDYLLIKPVAVAINPTDCKAIQQGRAAKDGLLGTDFAGVVEEVGDQVTKPWKKGDRVFGCTHGANVNNPEDGAYAEIIAAKGDTCMRIPANMTFEEACTLPASILTAGQGLFEEMKLNLPNNPIQDQQYILIYGGSSSTGLVGIQLAKLAGYAVLTTCSPQNSALCKSRGAEAVFDYRDPRTAEQIQDYTGANLRLVWDTIGSDEGVQICAKALSTEPGLKKYGTILFNSFPREDVVYSSSFLVTFLGEAFDKFGKHMPASTKNWEFAKMFAQLAENLCWEGKIQSHPVSLGDGGLEGLLRNGVPLMLRGGVSGTKLVYNIQDTL